MPKCTDCINYLGDGGPTSGHTPKDCKKKHYAERPNDKDMDCNSFESKSTNQVRQFSTGATRDIDTGKLNYVKALSPIVMKCYVEYLGKHRKQADGSLRDWDNWKAGIPKDVYVEGEDRHHRAVWSLHQGFPAYDNHGPVTLKDSLCGVIFNAMGHLHELLKAEGKDESNS